MVNEFILWYNDQFKQTDMYAAMLGLAEESPWHREHSIAVHTDMVVMEYIRRLPATWNYDEVLGAFACAFHDVGKPGAVQHKWKEERGNYKSFGGHELLSARLWEDWAVRNWTFLSETFNLMPDDIYRVGYLIEFHKPWDITHDDKLHAMAMTLSAMSIPHIFQQVVKSDTWGRMSDDSDSKRAKVTAWCEDFNFRAIAIAGHSVLHDVNNPKLKPVMYVPIAASGSGKTTLFNELSSRWDLNVFSLDLMRHELYGDDYELAFLKSTKDNHFRSACNTRFRDVLRENKSLFLDNTNTSRKNRRWYITEARNRGYHIVACLLPVDLQTVRDRQTTRPDKTVPVEAVDRQYLGLQLPQYLEFDNVLVFDNNLPK